MGIIHLLVLAFVQGLTEFLPISSSAHLILVPVLTGWPDQGLAFDVAVHVGTLLAVIVYFRTELGRMIRDWMRSLTGHAATADARLAWFVLLASVPVIILGFFGADLIETYLRTPAVIAATTLGFGLLLGWADWWAQRLHSEDMLGWRGTLFIGLGQALALIPGTSRSGITITAGLALGLTRQAAARFSFLLSIPVILAAGSYETYHLAVQPHAIDWNILIVALVVAGLFAYLCIRLFLGFIERVGLWPFVVYRLVLGLVLLIVLV